MTVRLDSPAATGLGAEQVEATPPAGSPSRLDERQFLRSLDNDEYRETLRGLFETAKAVGMVFEWGSVGTSIRLHTPDRDEPLTVAWAFPDRAGWSGLRHLTLGYDTGSAKNTPSVQDALSEYVDAVRLVPGAVRATARALQAYTFAPEAVCAQQEQLARLLRQLASRAQDRRSGPDSAATHAALVLVHQAYFIGARAQGYPHYFVKVTNVLQSRDIEITHVWFDADPLVHLVLPERPLPARLRPNETWEGWVDAAAVAHVADVERSGRVRLSDGTIIESRPNTDVPPVGYVAGPGSH
jgi:hypothetical protein